MAFNKLFVMLPVMLAARTLDGEDPKIVNLLRMAYGLVQACCVVLVLFTYVRATAAGEKAQGTIYVPPPPQVRSVVLFALHTIFCSLKQPSTPL